MQEVIILPMRDIVVFPGTITTLFLNAGPATEMIAKSHAKSPFVGMFLEKEPNLLHPVGVFAKIIKFSGDGNGSAKLLIEGVERVQIGEVTHQGDYVSAKILRSVENIGGEKEEFSLLMQNILDVFHKYAEGKDSNISNDAMVEIENEKSSSRVLDFITHALGLKPQVAQEFLDQLDLKKRAENVYHLLDNRVQAVDFRKNIRKKIGEKLNKREREFILREEMKEIEKELGKTTDGEVESNDPDIKELREKIKEAELPEVAGEAMKKEVQRLGRANPASPDHALIRDYIEWVADLPWHKKSKTAIDLAKAQKELDKNHAALPEVKERILEHLATQKLAGKKARGQILCFFGPPGTGKTSIGQSIAKAMGREFVRFALGGMRDEAEIRGHRRTYVGAMPGRILQRLKRSGVRNPVFMLDEIDKIGADFRGDPASALLEVLDPEQNSEFNDHYLDLPFDLSQCFFITTANDLSTIPSALRDRLEIIEFTSYTEDEKIAIAKKHLLGRVFERHGLLKDKVEFADEILVDIVRGYTREAGLRNLERLLSKIARKVAREIVENEKSKAKIRVTSKNLSKYLGPRQIPEDVHKIDAPGQSMGLAWTAAGGTMIPIEAAAMPGKGNLKITGQLGDVMKESTEMSLNFLRANAKRFGLPNHFLEKRDVHVHVPEGAVKKDGPSAGITITSALWSLFAGEKLRDGVAMTGEMTLTGKVTAVGGVREKVIAAYKNGMKEVVLPADCEKDLEKIPEDVRKNLKFHFVRKFEEVLGIVR